jgi:actin-related protein 5
MWLKQLRTKHQSLADKIKARRRKKTQLSDRRSLASQMRMKSIANLASDAPVGSKRKRKKNEGKWFCIFVNVCTFSLISATGIDDTFGADDADWSVYRDIVSSTMQV